MKPGKKETNLENKEAKSKVKSKKSVIAITALAIGNAFALSAATYAWFYLSSGAGSKMSTFSGDLDVNIEKVSAYKYVYPYHNNSTEFVDYDGEGTVKSYVVEDSSIEVPDNLGNKVTFSLGTVASQSYVTNLNDNTKGPSKIHYETSQDFKYYLVGNNVFTGVSNTNENNYEWSTLTATAFSRRETPTVSAPVTVENIVVSAGAEFIFFNAHTVSAGTCSYYTYNSPSVTGGTNSRFVVEGTNRLKCLKSGIYKFDYRVDTGGNNYLDITLTSRDDNAIIGSNLIDPTKITIDYRGSASATYTSLNDYLPVAIQEQNTLVVLDVELSYDNKNAIDVGLKIIRENMKTNQSIYSFAGKYNTTNEYTFRGYVDNTHRNPLCASDFYAFYTQIAKNENAYATPTEAWNAFHSTYQTDYETVAGKQRIVPLDEPYNKFLNDTSYDTTVECDIHPKTINDSALIPGSTTDNECHFYIAIDYDYEHMAFFTNQNRLGKTYLLDRDFRFYFTATEHIEEGPAPSPLIYKGGEDD